MVFNLGRSTSHFAPTKILFTIMSFNFPKVLSLTVNDDNSGMSASHTHKPLSPVTVNTTSSLNTFEPNSTVASALQSARHHRHVHPLDSCSSFTLSNRLSVKVRLLHG